MSAALTLPAVTSPSVKTRLGDWVTAGVLRSLDSLRASTHHGEALVSRVRVSEVFPMKHDPQANRGHTLAGATALLVVVVFSQGCLIWSGTSRLAEPTNPSSAQSPVPAVPSLKVVLYHEHRMEGRTSGAGAIDMTYRQFQKAFDRAQTEIPFLANASFERQVPDYILDLDTTVDEHGKTSARVAGATFGIVPGFTSSDVVVRATLKTLEGERLFTHEAASEVKAAFHILLVPLLPFVPFIAPGRDSYDDPMRSAITAVAADFAASPPPPAGASETTP
jgi:hypothetical protein